MKKSEREGEETGIKERKENKNRIESVEINSGDETAGQLSVSASSHLLREEAGRKREEGKWGGLVCHPVTSSPRTSSGRVTQHIILARRDWA